MALRLDRRISVLRPVSNKNGLGEKVADDWAEVATVQASFVPVTAKERMQAGALEQIAEAVFIVRWSERLADVDGAHRLQLGGRIWKISGVSMVGRRRLLELAAVEVKQPGA